MIQVESPPSDRHEYLLQAALDAALDALLLPTHLSSRAIPKDHPTQALTFPSSPLRI